MYAGNGGPATSGSFNGPISIALDRLGTVYVGEKYAIRKVLLGSGIILTAVGDGTSFENGGDGSTYTANVSDPYGLFIDDSQNLFFSEKGLPRIRKATYSTVQTETIAGNGLKNYSGDGGAAKLASLVPGPIAVDRSQNLYFADY